MAGCRNSGYPPLLDMVRERGGTGQYKERNMAGDDSNVMVAMKFASVAN